MAHRAKYVQLISFDHTSVPYATYHSINYLNLNDNLEEKAMNYMLDYLD